MKKKSILVSIFTLIITAFSGLEANAQAMLQGNPSLQNFIGSPGMWIITTGIILMIAFVLIMRRSSKLIPEPVRKKS